MKKFFLAVIATALMMTGFSQSDENKTNRKVSGFHGVQISGGIDLYLSSGTESVSLSANSASVIEHIKTEVVNGILRIYLDENFPRHQRDMKMRAYVSIGDLTNLEASGGSDIILQTPIKTGDLEVRLSGGSDLKGKLNASHLNIEQSGGSDVDISGNVQYLVVNASGGSDFGGYGLVTDYATLHASGGSDTELTVNKEFKIVASGGSEVSYKGTASVKEIKSSGSSTVTHKD